MEILKPIEKLNFFEKEISMIKYKTIRELASTIIVEAPEWFFTMPASSSGKNHPEYARGKRGLLLHTKAVVYLLHEMFRSQMYDIDEYHQDLLIVAAIAHDIKKFGNTDYTGHTVKEHPELAAAYVENINSVYNILDIDSINYIKRCILSHMGVWGNILPETVDEKLLHLADLLASRKEITIDLKEYDTRE